ncbi:hypothetical protein [Sediminicola luteus]|uniref:Uncharacterized protein n=1 Tax=Sediminicola luteus TaxID=319238 RepID=A0A2A4G645_9FLAO|nr:hypothetical protein [Sediminicola luteus]PCE63903.1 hypothetical protein B7P33_11620 [Sediminicola luteus]
MRIIQKKLFLSKEIEIKDKHVKLKSKDLTGSQELIIPIEEFDISRIVYQKNTDNVMLVITLIFGFFFIINILNPANYSDDGEGLIGVLIFLFSITSLCSLITYVKSKHIVLIPTLNNGYIEIFRSRPNEYEVDNLIDYLDKRIAEILKDKYGTIDKDLPIEHQLMNLKWLHERKVITDLEFEKLKFELTGNQKGTNSIGYYNQ